jgi:hypothetical protein
VVWLVLAGDADTDTDTDTAGSDDPTSSATTTGEPRPPTGSASPSPTGEAPSPTTSPTAIRPVQVPFGEDVDLGNGVNVDIVDIEAVEGKGGRPGEVGGPSVRFTVRVANESSEALNLDLAIVNAYYGPDERPATRLQEPGGVPLPQRLPRGEVATGRYIFNIPPDERDLVRVEFVYTVEAPMVIYTGEARG